MSITSHIYIVSSLYFKMLAPCPNFSWTNNMVSSYRNFFRKFFETVTSLKAYFPLNPFTSPSVYFKELFGQYPVFFTQKLLGVGVKFLANFDQTKPLI